MRTMIIVLSLLLPMAAQAQKLEKATFAAGCFWCTEEAFEKVPGVVSAVSGYIGGTVRNPTYDQVSSGRTGHTEAYHQDFYKTNSVHYRFYVAGCGRYPRLDNLWGDLRKK